MRYYELMYYKKNCQKKKVIQVYINYRDYGKRYWNDLPGDIMQE